MAQVETRYTSVTRPFRGFDPFLWLWRLLTSVRFALALIGFLALAGLLAVVLPQVPAPMEGNDVAISVWLDVREETYGPFTQPMYRAGLFDIFSAWWFLASLWLLVASVTVCTVNRFPSTWRNIRAPQQRVPESFFERAGNRAVLDAGAGAIDASVLERTLRKRRFRVERFEEKNTTYLFADRFSFTQLGTFISHLALIMFLAGALVSSREGFTADLFIAEGSASPVFAVSDPDQMQVEVLDASATFDDDGAAVDYHTDLVIYQGGEEVARGSSTVNDPVSYDGYRFHQASYLGEGAALRVRDVATGNTLYSETLALVERVPAPAVSIRDAAGSVLVEDVIVPTDFLAAGAAGTLITPSGGNASFWVGTQQAEGGGWEMLVYTPSDPNNSLTLGPAETASLGGLDFTFEEAQALPAVLTSGIPGDSESSEVLFSRDEEGAPMLTVLGPAEGRALVLAESEPVTIDGREYTFEGEREFSGIQVRKDPGANFIWLATGLLLIGLVITFYLPRLRLWARVTKDETVIAGLAERSGPFRKETDRIARELGVPRRDASLDEHAASQ
jgi:cytochrome c biogenesis protein ResB